jgi:hypothetical protein
MGQCNDCPPRQSAIHAAMAVNDATMAPAFERTTTPASNPTPVAATMISHKPNTPQVITLHDGAATVDNTIACKKIGMSRATLATAIAANFACNTVATLTGEAKVRSQVPARRSLGTLRAANAHAAAPTHHSEIPIARDKSATDPATSPPNAKPIPAGTAAAAAAPQTSGVATSERNSLLKATANPLKKSALSILDEGEHVRR